MALLALGAPAVAYHPGRAAAEGFESMLFATRTEQEQEPQCATRLGLGLLPPFIMLHEWYTSMHTGGVQICSKYGHACMPSVEDVHPFTVTCIQYTQNEHTYRLTRACIYTHMYTYIGILLEY